MTNSRKPKRKSRKTVTILVIIALIITAICLDSRYRLTVTEYELSYDQLPPGFDGFKIVQLTDLHLKTFGEDNAKLIAAVDAQAPDIIVLTGDFINRRLTDAQLGQSEKLRVFLNNLALLAPCYFVSGNHEWASGELDSFAAILEEAGIRYLRNEFVTLERNGDQIILAGVEDPNGPADMIKPSKLIESIENGYPNGFIILLGHRDDWLVKYPSLDVDIIMSGHAHGGVVRLPFIGGLFSTEYALFPKYDAGLYNEGAYDFILSRGLGNFNIIPRFLNPPEIVALTLRSA